jgi:hypothetical protein
MGAATTLFIYCALAEKFGTNNYGRAENFLYENPVTLAVVVIQKKFRVPSGKEDGH